MENRTRAWIGITLAVGIAFLLDESIERSTAMIGRPEGILREILTFPGTVLYAILLGVVTLFLMDDRTRWARVLLGVLLAVAVCHASKLAVGRARPREHAGAYKFEPFHGGAAFGSFPSGHTTLAFAGATGVTLLVKRGRWLVLGLAALGAISRVWWAAHWTSDVFAGAVLGVSCVLACVRIDVFKSLASAKTAAVGACLLIAINVGGCEKATAVAVSTTVPSHERSVTLFAMGDWGSEKPAQVRVAKVLAEKATVRPDAVLLLGDNFYGTLADANDAKWKRYFESMYSAAKLACPFYAVLGNNDYEEKKPEAQLAYGTRGGRWTMPARWYRVEIPSDRPLVTILMLDSNYDAMSLEMWNQETQWLASELQRPRETPWLIVAGHHPIYSNGKHGATPTLIADWLPLFRKANVDFYLCGHDHDLERIKRDDSTIDFLISGGGGADVRSVNSSSDSRFALEGNGVLKLTLGEKSSDVTFFDDSGQAVHSFSRAVAK